MRKLAHHMVSKMIGINEKVGQVINEDEEFYAIEAMKIENRAMGELEDHEEFPRYQMLYEYFTCSYFTVI